MNWLKKLLRPKNLWDKDECPLCYIPEDGSYLFHNPEITYRKNQLCSKHLQDLSD